MITFIVDIKTLNKGTMANVSVKSENETEREIEMASMIQNGLKQLFISFNNENLENTKLFGEIPNSEMSKRDIIDLLNRNKN